MSLIPGIAGQKTELIDGAKIDSINEYTTSNGVQLQGRTNGVSIGNGLIGQHNKSSTGNYRVTDVGENFITKDFEAGVWMIVSTINYVGVASGQNLRYLGHQIKDGATVLGNAAGALAQHPTYTDYWGGSSTISTIINTSVTKTITFYGSIAGSGIPAGNTIVWYMSAYRIA